MPLRHLPTTKPTAAPKAGDSEAFKEVAVAHKSRHVSGEFYDDVAAEGKNEETSKTAAVVRISASEILAAKGAAKNFSGPGAALVPMAVASAAEEVRQAVEEILGLPQFMTNEDFAREDAETRRVANERALAMAEVVRKIEDQEKIARREFHKKNLLARRELKKRMEKAEAAAQERAAEREEDGLGAFRAFGDGTTQSQAAHPAAPAPIAGPGSQSRKRGEHRRAKPIAQDEVAAAKEEMGQEYEDLALFGAIAHRFAHDQEGGLAFLGKIRAAKMNERERKLFLEFVESKGLPPEQALQNVERIQKATPQKPRTTRKIA